MSPPPSVGQHDRRNRAATQGATGMKRIILIYGLAAGVVIILGMIGTIVLPSGEAHHSSLWLGYLIMLLGLTAILLGVKDYRDRVQGGVIKFGKAFLLGVGIALVASLAYVAIWEIYLALNGYNFIDQYAASTLAAKRAAGLSGAAYQKVVAEMDSMRRAYANPLMRMGMTFTEIFPVGLLVALVSAALLRNTWFLPARPRPA
jgi:hypothetical protein